MEANLFLHLISFILLIFALGNVKASSTTDSFIHKPDEEVYSEEGSDVTLEWHFHVGSWSSSSTAREFLFGVWDDPGFVKNKILAVQERNVVSKRRGFERKVDWSGNIYDCVNCTARVKMYNLTDVDFKKYGVEVELGLDRSHLTNWLRLVKFENRTTIKTTQNDSPVLDQTTDPNITGFIKEPLDLMCIKPRRDKNMTVARHLSQNLEEPDKLERFVISKWSQKGYTKLCNTEHKLYNLCSQVTSYVTANVTHFVIESAPLEFNKCKTRCAYRYKGLEPDSQGSVQIIELRDKIEGYVGGRIEIKCSSPSRCRSVTLKINNTETKISDTNMSFPCLRDGYYDICNDHMNSSYVNGTCRVIFVFDNTPVFLNNTRLHCHIRFQNVSTDNYHDLIDTIMLLRYKKNDSAVTTASSLPATYLPGKTSATASSTTTSTNGMTTSTEKDGLSKKVIAIIVSFVVVVVVAAAAVVVKYRHRIKSCCHNVLTRVRHRCCGNQNDHEVVWL